GRSTRKLPGVGAGGHRGRQLPSEPAIAADHERHPLTPRTQRDRTWPVALHLDAWVGHREGNTFSSSKLGDSTWPSGLRIAKPSRTTRTSNTRRGRLGSSPTSRHPRRAQQTFAAWTALPIDVD